MSFASNATNLVVGDTDAVADVFRRDRTWASTIRASVSTAEVQPDDGVDLGSGISGDGQAVAFSSIAWNLAGVDFNASYDGCAHRDRRHANDRGHLLGTGPGPITAVAASFLLTLT